MPENEGIKDVKKPSAILFEIYWIWKTYYTIISCTHNEPAPLQRRIQSILNHTFFDSQVFFFATMKNSKENIYDSCFISFNLILDEKELRGENEGREVFPLSKSLPVRLLLPLIFLFIWKLLYLETEYSLKCDPVESQSEEWRKISFQLLLLWSIFIFLALAFKLHSKQANYHRTSLLSLLFTVVGYLYRKLYTFIFPIIILLSFTRRRELFVRP